MSAVTLWAKQIIRRYVSCQIDRDDKSYADIAAEELHAIEQIISHHPRDPGRAMFSLRDRLKEILKP